MPKNLENGTKVICVEEAHSYEINGVFNGKVICLGGAIFQKGVISEKGVNGIQMEDLITICIDRLKTFQQGDYACKENACCLTHLEEARMWLDARTMDRQNRKVEGKNEV